MGLCVTAEPDTKAAAMKPTPASETMPGSRRAIRRDVGVRTMGGASIVTVI